MAAVCRMLFKPDERRETVKISALGALWEIEEIRSEIGADGHERLTLVYRKEVPNAR